MFRKKPRENEGQKLLPAKTGKSAPFVTRETPEERFGVICSQGPNGHPVFTDAFMFNPRRRRDINRIERTVAVHWWRPNLPEVLEIVDEFSLLSLSIPKDPFEFENQQETVALNNQNHEYWQTAMWNWAFPAKDLPFGRSSVIWTRADRMIPENQFTRTASIYGVIPQFNETASLINSCLMSSQINFEGTHTPGSQLSKTMVHHIKWGSSENNKPKSDAYYSIGDHYWAIWAVMVNDLGKLRRLLRRPFDVLVYVMKEYLINNEPTKVESGEISDFFATMFVRVEAEDPDDFKNIGKELSTICSHQLRLRGMDLVEAFQAFVPGSPPPKNNHHMQYSLATEDWHGFLNELVRNNTKAHSTNGGTFLGQLAHVVEKEDGTFEIINPNGPNVFYDFSEVTSLGCIAVSGEGKTTYELCLFFQRHGPFALIINLAPGQNEAAEFLVRNFDPENGDAHVKILSFDDSEDQESVVRQNARDYAQNLVSQMKLTGEFVASPLYITPANRHSLNHTWIAEFLAEFRDAWAILSRVEDKKTNTPGGLFAGKTLGIMIDNVSNAKEHPELLSQLENLANNGKNQGIQSDHLSHTTEGLPASYVGALAYQIKAWRIDNLFIYRLIRPDGKPVTPYINGTLPVWIKEWFARRNEIAGK